LPVPFIQEKEGLLFRKGGISFGSWSLIASLGSPSDIGLLA